MVETRFRTFLEFTFAHKKVLRLRTFLV